jgi:hypothetical protein
MNTSVQTTQHPN